MPILIHGIVALAALLAAGIGLYQCSRIGAMAVVYEATLGGKPLPHATQWALNYRAFFFLAQLFVPGAVLATFLLRDRRAAICAGLALLLLAGLLAFCVGFFLELPFIGISRSMSAGARGM